MGRLLQTHPLLIAVHRLSIFLSPLSKDEIVYLKAPERHVSLEAFVTDVMRRKLLRRTRRQKGELSLKDLENIETRASSAYRELQEASHFQYVIPNHDGEDSDHWEAFYYLVGDARPSLHAVVALLEGAMPPVVETWEEDVVPPADSPSGGTGAAAERASVHATRHTDGVRSCRDTQLTNMIGVPMVTDWAQLQDWSRLIRPRRRAAKSAAHTGSDRGVVGA